ncbi:MAG: inorganic phosphate transporter [Waddliaceae bacterium]|nr:inorganic phosphate transporter [Waddliaceae bacterium]
MDNVTLLFIIALLSGLYMSWSLGANDAANAIGTAVGSGALTLKRAVIIAASLEFCGAFFFGSNVSETVQKGIVKMDLFVDDPMLLVFGMIGALLAAGVWLQLASYKGWPVSTTHSIVGALVGFGLVIGGVNGIHWNKVASIVISWVISPLMGGTISYIAFVSIRKKIFYSPHPLNAAKKTIPYIVFCMLTMLSSILLFRGLKNVNLDLSFLETAALALSIGLIGSIVIGFLIRRIKAPDSSDLPYQSPVAVTALRKALKHLQRMQIASKGDLNYQVSLVVDEAKALKEHIDYHDKNIGEHAHFAPVEKIFASLQLITACFMAFAHGANDVANAIGPLAACVSVLSNGFVVGATEIPAWILVVGGCGIIFGLGTWGWRVIETIGKKITELTPSRGFAAEIGASTTIVLASSFGLPVSTTHILVGAIFGVGIARGMSALNMGTIRDIVLSWFITIPAGAALTIVFFYILKAIFG